MKLMIIHERELHASANGKLSIESAISSPRGGGLAVYLVSTVNALRERGMEVVVLGLTPQAESSDEGFYNLKPFRFRYVARTVSRFKEILRSENPDVVHLHSIFHDIHPVMLRFLLDEFRVVSSFHDVRPFCFWGTLLHRDERLCERPVGSRCVTTGCYRPGGNTRLLADMIRIATLPRYLALHRRVPIFITPSHYLREVLIRNGFDQSRIDVNPLFSRFELLAHTPPPSDEPPNILYVGRLDVEKGIDHFLRALARVTDHAWTATVVGDGPRLMAARAFVSRQGLADRIRFEPSADEHRLRDHYARCRFVVLPSLVAESFGLVGLEAMAFGRAVVAYPSGGVLEWLEDGVTGLIAPHGNTQLLAEQIVRLLKDFDLCVRLGAMGRRRVRQRFTLERHLEGLNTDYARLRERAAGCAS